MALYLTNQPLVAHQMFISDALKICTNLYCSGPLGLGAARSYALFFTTKSAQIMTFTVIIISINSYRKKCNETICILKCNSLPDTKLTNYTKH